ncbi:MAG: threonine--tRNA ligase [Rickettsiales bacterium]|jgi:threonyl-tRNA synthetase|nr:threonine--tRNA ligase [Rickettsiales bacterium]
MVEQNLEILRHSAAHILAQAVMRQYPGAELAIGPAVENGFYYDVDVAQKITPEDLPALEEKMREIIKANLPIVREEVPIEEARRMFAGRPYKLEILAGITDPVVSIYRQGEFFDLCRGPHLASTGLLPPDAFKLTSVAGAYWRGDSKNKMLQRIYGVAFASKAELASYLTIMEEAVRRDHRKLGAAMDLFHFEPEYAPGGVFWHPYGWALFQKLVNYMRARQEAEGYVEISTPAVCNRLMWETSGHWDKFAQHIYYAKVRDEDGEFAVKPVNCPGGMLVYKQGIKSYRDLPLKVAEFGKVDRYEASGSLFGLLRVREFTQDDAHIFCTPEQVEEECVKVIRLIMDIYRDFGFERVRIKLSTRPDVRLGSDEVWDRSEQALADALSHNGYEYTIFPGEGAIYGPKLEFVLTDAIGRDWQCGTLQFDMNLPERFDLWYVDSDGTKKRPVMLHRALFGSLERFTGILIEHYAGKLPLWLSPRPVVIATITSAADGYAREVMAALKHDGVAAELDLSNEKISHKIRVLSEAKVPVIAVVGEKEASTRTLTLRRLGSSEQETVGLDDFIEEMAAACAGRANGHAVPRARPDSRA